MEMSTVDPRHEYNWSFGVKVGVLGWMCLPFFFSFSLLTIPQ